MRQRSIHICRLILLTALAVQLTPVHATVSSEVLLFVDVSGSMIKNDPDNVRAPAIRMLAGMAPDDARVGIFLFGTDVRTLVAPDNVNPDWQQQVEKLSSRFRSRDMYTNIEAALLTAKQNWSGSDETTRSIILLTDGIVDIDKNSVVSEASRNRILNSVLAELRAEGVTVNTIALSANADHDLLEKIALGTDGSTLQVDKAEQLQRSFMHLFEQSAPRDSVPLTGNTFTVDKSISEITLLVFNSTAEQATEVISPEGEIYRHDTAADGLNWKHDVGYDLVTIRNPVPGEWQLNAEEDPDNRAMIVTDLKMMTTLLPNNIIQGESLSWTAWFEEFGNPVLKPEFLNLMSAAITSSSDQTSYPMQMNLDEGTYTFVMNDAFKPGEHELLLTMDSGTFVREARAKFTIHATPLLVTHELMSDEEFKLAMNNRKKVIPKNILNPEHIFEPDRGWNVVVRPVPELLNSATIALEIELQSQSGTVTPVDHNLIQDEDENGPYWELEFIPTEAGENTVMINLNGQTTDGRVISLKDDALKLGEHVAESELNMANAEKESEQAMSLPSMNKVILPVVVFNLIIGIGVLAWFLYRKFKKHEVLQPEEAL